MVEIGAVAVHLGDGGDGREPGRLHALPHAAHLGAHAVHGVHHEDDAVHGRKHPFQVAGEVGVTGHVHQAMAVALPVKGGEAGLDGAAALDLFGFVVQGGVAAFDGAKAADDAGLKKKHFRKRGLAAAARSKQGVGALFLQSDGHAKLRS